MEDERRGKVTLTAVHHQVVQDQCHCLEDTVVLSVMEIGEQYNPHPFQEGDPGQWEKGREEEKD